MTMADDTDTSDTPVKDLFGRAEDALRDFTARYQEAELAAGQMLAAFRDLLDSARSPEPG
jgi:uncharacterized protein YaaN involved in tellurite resistance